MNPSADRNARISAIRKNVTEFLESLRKVEPDLLVQLVIELHPEDKQAGYKFEITEGLTPLPGPPFKDHSGPPFRDVPFKDNPWHDHAKPPDFDLRETK